MKRKSEREGRRRPTGQSAKRAGAQFKKKKRQSTRKPGRPAGRTGDQRRTELLEAARALATLKSLTEISLSEVSEAAGVAPPLARYYFGSREGLQSALIDHMITNQIPKFRMLAAIQGPVEERLRQFIKGMLQSLHDLDGLIQIVLTHVLFPSDAATERFVREFTRPIVNIIKPIVDQGIAEGKFRRVKYMYFHVSVAGAILFFLASQPQTAPAYDHKETYETSLQEFGDFVADVFVSYLLAK
jgi:TetR/AcrR family transcriptional regulator